RPEPAGASAVMSRTARWLRRRGAFVYPAESQAAYKLKWTPDLLMREYIAGFPLSPRAVLDLLMLTRSLCLLSPTRFPRPPFPVSRLVRAARCGRRSATRSLRWRSMPTACGAMGDFTVPWVLGPVVVCCLP